MGLLIIGGLLLQVVVTYRRHVKMKRAAERKRLAELAEKKRPGSPMQIVRTLRGLMAEESEESSSERDVFLNGQLLREGRDHDYWWGDNGALHFDLRVRRHDVLQVREAGSSPMVYLDTAVGQDYAPGEPVSLEGSPPPPRKELPPGPPAGFVLVPNETRAGDLIKMGGEEYYVGEVTHQISPEGHATWAKLQPAPLPKSAWDRIISDDEVV